MLNLLLGLGKSIFSIKKIPAIIITNIRINLINNLKRKLPMVVSRLYLSCIVKKYI
jgi:hypothetical protein